MKTRAFGIAGAVGIACMMQLLACSKGQRSSLAPGASSASASASALASSSATAASATAASATAASATAASAAPVDLLHFGPASLAVPSSINNGHDLPQHLVDGLESTAWNSRTGGIEDSYIRFTIPADSRVTSLVMSAGFNQVNAKGEDLFVMNHRLQTVIVSLRDGKAKPIEWKLDPQVRTPQTLAVDLPGGEYVLELGPTLPGTKTDWKEITISEFRVMGSPGAVRFATRRMPDIRIGSSAMLRDVSNGRDPNPYGVFAPTAKALCALLNEPNAEDVPPPSCTIGPRLPATQSKDAFIKGVHRLERGLRDDFSEWGYVLETDKGWVVPERAIWKQLPFRKGGYDDMEKTTVTVTKVENTAGETLGLTGQWATVYLNEHVVDHESISPGVHDGKFLLHCDVQNTPVTCMLLEQQRSCRFQKSRMDLTLQPGPCDAQ